jgi:polysaccharide export outer membrane protein
VVDPILKQILPWLVIGSLIFLNGGLAAQALSLTPGAQTVRPGDVIRLNIWREPDMSGDFVVDEAGLVVFARVGEYSVLAETPNSLEARLIADYGRFLREPNINVTVLRRIIVRGAVNDPGLKQVDPTITIAAALALAGGATSLGDQNKIRILRDGQEIEGDVTLDTRLADSIIRSGDQIFVPERSWISRNTGIVATSISGSIALVIALFIR